jgi:hypothetical protein
VRYRKTVTFSFPIIDILQENVKETTRSQNKFHWIHTLVITHVYNFTMRSKIADCGAIVATSSRTLRQPRAPGNEGGKKLQCDWIKFAVLLNFDEFRPMRQHPA